MAIVCSLTSVTSEGGCGLSDLSPFTAAAPEKTTTVLNCLSLSHKLETPTKVNQKVSESFPSVGWSLAKETCVCVCVYVHVYMCVRLCVYVLTYWFQ